MVIENGTQDKATTSYWSAIVLFVPFSSYSTLKNVVTLRGNDTSRVVNCLFIYSTGNYD